MLNNTKCQHNSTWIVTETCNVTFTQYENHETSCLYFTGTNHFPLDSWRDSRLMTKASHFLLVWREETEGSKFCYITEGQKSIPLKLGPLCSIRTALRALLSNVITYFPVRSSHVKTYLFISGEKISCCIFDIAPWILEGKKSERFLSVPQGGG